MDESKNQSMDEQIKLSVITPSYNQGAFIERTIQSVLNQNVKNIEYWVIDGGSHDETLTHLNKYKDYLRYISEPDGGQAHGVNKGLSYVTGDIIGWINSDDIYYPEVFNKILQYFKAHPEIDIIYGKANHIDDNDNIIESYPTEHWNIKRLLETCYISQPSVFFRKKVFDEVGMLDEQLNFCMDYEYWLRSAFKGMRFFYFKECLSGSRLHSHAKTMMSPLLATYETMTMLKKKIGYVPGSWLMNYAVLKVKQKTKFRFPEIIFILLFSIVFTFYAIRWNGVLRGLLALINLPVTIVRKRKRNSKQSCDHQNAVYS